MPHIDPVVLAYELLRFGRVPQLGIEVSDDDDGASTEPLELVSDRLHGRTRKRPSFGVMVGVGGAVYNGNGRMYRIAHVYPVDSASSSFGDLLREIRLGLKWYHWISLS